MEEGEKETQEEGKEAFLSGVELVDTVENCISLPSPSSDSLQSSVGEYDELRGQEEMSGGHCESPGAEESPHEVPSEPEVLLADCEGDDDLASVDGPNAIHSSSPVSGEGWCPEGVHEERGESPSSVRKSVGFANPVTQAGSPGDLIVPARGLAHAVKELHEEPSKHGGVLSSFFLEKRRARLCLLLCLPAFCFSYCLCHVWL